MKKGNIPIPDLRHDDDVWLMLVVTSAIERRTQDGKPFFDVIGRNATGTIAVKIWSEAIEKNDPMKPGLWGITGRIQNFKDRLQLVADEYRPITLEQYREHQNADPVLPKAYTIDIETLALPGFRERVGPQLARLMRLGNMRLEQQQRYTEDQAAEEERCYQLGSLNSTSGRVLCIAVQVASVYGTDFEALPEVEYAFGIDAEGNEQDEAIALADFVQLMSGFDPDADEIVGHNILNFDLPFIFQRCLINNIAVRPFVDLSEFRVRGVYDTMHHWWLGARKYVSLDDIAWALGVESSKTADVEGSKVFELYQTGRLADIREYNLNDVRLTRKVYERMVACFGR